MYSLVLMMALSGGVEAPAGHHDCCGGCYGCCGGWSCGGYGCCGCCGGCHGGHGCHGCHGGHSFFHHHDSCCGGCYSSCCCGGGYYGCCGCSGYCCGGGYYGCCGGYNGCCGGYYGCCGGGYYGCCGGTVAPPAPPVTPPVPPPDGGKPMPPPDGGKPMPPPDDAPKPKVGTEANIPAPATIIVSLPADAKLMIDDFATKSTSASRVFTSPELNPAQAFSYTLKAEIVRNGQTLTATEQVSVRAGAETRVSLSAEKFATAAVAQK
jgi:uncharacterized protein (TIGR03000 family)